MGWVLALWLVWMVYLAVESCRVRRARRMLRHVVHVNGTRGKSTVSRMIAAGLRAGDIPVFCKTTGTEPMVIDVDGQERPILRRGKANIKEQIGVMRQAAAQGAQVLVIECMAVQPELQYAAQHRILRADIGVITNVRRDHTDVMGTTLEEIGQALSNTVPRGGVLFTAEETHSGPLERRAEEMMCRMRTVRPGGEEPEFDFPENIALALAVCEELGVERETALEGIRHFCKDPYALGVYRLGRALFINGLSINDIQSTQLVYQKVAKQYRLEGRRLILVVNNRADRGSRTRDMLAVCRALRPEEVWLLGAAKGYMAAGIRRALPGTGIRRLKTCGEIQTERLEEGQVLFAIGNIADQGKELMALVRERGMQLV